MSRWKPIDKEEFEKHYKEQYSSLTEVERKKFDPFRLEICNAKIKRSEMNREESVFVIAKDKDGVLYFDDVEYGFNISRIDKRNIILDRGGSQYSLQEAINVWFPKNG